MKEWLKPVAAGLVTGLLAGTLVLGIGGLIAIVAGLPGNYSWGGSLK